MKRYVTNLLVFLVLFSVSPAYAKPAGTPWDKLQFLIGDWEGAEGVYTNEHFSFAFDLQNRVILQKSHAGSAAIRHAPYDGLMIIYLDQVTQKIRADYFDNSGNVLHYTAEVNPDGQAVTFISEADAIGHRFRTTYFKRKDGAIGIKTIMAEPGRSDFNLMNEGAAYRK
jgi:hypothetical protein